jgi:hypothetical protein
MLQHDGFLPFNIVNETGIARRTFQPLGRVPSGLEPAAPVLPR